MENSRTAKAVCEEEDSEEEDSEEEDSEVEDSEEKEDSVTDFKRCFFPTPEHTLVVYKSFPRRTLSMF